MEDQWRNDGLFVERYYQRVHSLVHQHQIWLASHNHSLDETIHFGTALTVELESIKYVLFIYI